MQRLDALDGLRGYFLVFMLLNHLAFADGLLLQRLNHKELGFVEDAQGFVFLSGLIVGLYYARLAGKQGPAVMAGKLRARAATLYRQHLFLVLALMGAALAYPPLIEAWGGLLGSALWEQPATTLLGSATLLYQGAFLDILPQYMLYLLAAPFLVRLCLRDRVMEVLAGSLLLWLAVQLGLHQPLAAALEAAVQGPLPGLSLRGAFNPLAWQVIFVVGLVLGVQVTRGRTETLARLFHPGDSGLLRVALVMLGIFLALRLGFSFGLLQDTALGERFRTQLYRPDFTLVYFLNFAALAYVVAWLLLCGPRSDSKLARGAAALVRRVLALRFLQLLGRHSLQVYLYHVLLVYALVALEWGVGGMTEVQRSLLALLAVATLAIPARLHEASARRAKAARAALRAQASRGYPAATASRSMASSGS